MASTCNGICKNHKSNRPGKSRYASGLKRCNSCNVFIQWKGLWCPCCGSKLRVRPRNSKNKEKLFAKISVVSRM